MTVRKRVSSEERRELILQAVIPVFAEKGFHGATTRILAEAAGVSEALLYKHFPSKESLYSGIFLRHLDEKTQNPKIQEILSEPPSTGKLIRLLSLLHRDITEPGDQCLPRLMAQSLLSDGAFARTVLDTFQQNFMHYFVDCLEAAQRSGDLSPDLELSRLPIWFTHHLAVSFKLLSLPPQDLIDYGEDRDSVSEQALRFCLRGFGIPQSSIDQHLPIAGDPS